MVASFIAKAIVRGFGDKFPIDTSKDKGFTERLEVEVKAGRKSHLVHSKRGGDGLIDSSNIGELIEKIKRIIHNEE